MRTESGENGFEVYVMCEIPSNAILAEQFAELFDGFSIGSNDLTQLTLGADRDNRTAPCFDENNEAVKDLIKRVIKVSKQKIYILESAGKRLQTLQICAFLGGKRE